MIHEPSDGEACESPAHEPLVCECRYPRPDAVGECTRCRRLVITIDAVTAHAAAGIDRLQQYLQCPDHPAWRKRDA